MPDAKFNISDLLLRIEIDAHDWERKTLGERIRCIYEQACKHSAKLVDAAGGFLDTFGRLVRANTSNPVIHGYLDLADMAYGLWQATTVANNLFVSAKHEVHSIYDNIAKMIGYQRGIDLLGDTIYATKNICEYFLGATQAEQDRYGFRFISIKNDADAKEVPGKGHVYAVAEFVRSGRRMKVGFELCYYGTQEKGDTISGEASSFITYALPGGEEELDDLYYEVPAIIYGIYVSRVDITKNMIRIKSGKLYTEPRVNIDFDVKNFDEVDDNGHTIRTMKSEAEFIRKVLDAKGRRGYIVQGDQGTGKTVSVNRLLMEFTDVPVFWISPDSIADSDSMDSVFRILNLFPGSFFIFDDFDGNDFSDKSGLAGEFINYIDETNSPAYRGITILIINEPQKLHSTIKNRPKRIDDIIYVRNPSTYEDIADVMTQTFKHLGRKAPEWVDPSNGELQDICHDISDAHLTHACIAGVVDDMLCYFNDEATPDNFRYLVERRKAAIRYSQMVALDDGHIVPGPPPAIKQAAANVNRLEPRKSE